MKMNKNTRSREEMKKKKNNKAQSTMLILFVTSVLVLWQSFTILPQR
jgi:hypothetical protein